MSKENESLYCVSDALLEFGMFIKKCRKNKKIPVRKFYIEDLGTSELFITNIEQGFLTPDLSQEGLKKIAKALDITEESVEWDKLNSLSLNITKAVVNSCIK